MKKQCKIRGGEAHPDAFGTYHNQNELITTRTNLSQLERPPRRHLSQLRNQFLLTAVIKPNEGSHRCQDGTHAIWAHVSKWCWLWYVRSCCNVRYCYVSVRSRGRFVYTETESCEGAMFPKRCYVNFLLLHICMYKVREPKVRHWESVRMRSISNEHHPRTMLILASGSDFLDFPRFGCMTESDHLRMKLFEKVLIWASASRFLDFPRPLEGVRNKSFSNENPFTQCLSWITAAELQDPRSRLQGKCSHCNNVCYAAE